MIKMILATDLDYAIGKNNELLWSCSEDLAYFKAQTINKVVVMGSRTYTSLPFTNGLPSRDNIVLTSRYCTDHEGVTFICGVSALLDYIEYSYSRRQEVFIVGGASIYEQFKHIVDEVHWTTINKTYEDADCFFDMSFVLDEDVFEKTSEEELCEDVVVRVYKRK